MSKTVAVVGLGYVGLPLAVAFGKQICTIGFDISEKKIESYRIKIDPTREVASDEFDAARWLRFTSNAADLAQADIIIIAVPTPVDGAHVPDFRPLRFASEIVGRQLRKGSIVVFESTVYPGATEEVCIPLLEKHSGLRWKRDFHVGYSPERVNPGDKDRTVTKITKVVSGDDDATLETLAALYGRIIEAGIYRASSIRVAEAAKVIENTQRDLNIALMNELAIIFNRLGIDTTEVLRAAGTKWNFLQFRPGLVGGHCIGVDPYYITYKAEMVGYHPQVILAGRRINDGMATYVAGQTIKGMIQNGAAVKGSRVIVLGLTFKENCSDLRNSKVAELVRELEEFGCDVFVHDPLAEPEEALAEYEIHLSDWLNLPENADALVVAVPHVQYLELQVPELLSKLKRGGLFVDIKSAYEPQKIADAGMSLWRL
jgi:UDP-N-acetyl-D-galactosamine dehydrogenase